METTTLGSNDIPTALPGFEDDNEREKLLLENASDEIEDADEEEMIGFQKPAPERKRRWQVLRTLAGFAVFLCILVVGLTWFFGMGWFSEPQTHPVSRSGQKDTQTSPATEDEKLKMALSMVSGPSIETVGNLRSPLDPDESTESLGNSIPENDTSGISTLTGVDQDRKIRIGENGQSFIPSTEETLIDRTIPSDNLKPVVRTESLGISTSRATDSDNARGRSLFFGISKKTAKDDDPRKPSGPEDTKVVSPDPVPPAQIPFGTLLPVRLVGSIYTLRNSGGFVRMELTRTVAGKGYAYPAGTMIVGSIRGGESTRAFVTVVGLIDPVSGELVRFTGELLGRDGGSGIEGKKRNLTSQWARFFRGMKETAASVLGSVGGFRSGSTVILSEPMRRSTESMTEDLAGAILKKNEREDTFLEVSAGSNGYVLVTDLPEDYTAATVGPAPEAGKE